ncbi:MAG: M48 family metallopeptidase [Rhizobiaceae bacterium]|nr:M48 family metallopeptidase [Rhizobiaceae bacterium]
MAYILPLLLALAYGIVSMRFSVWRTKSMLDRKSRPLRDPAIARLTDAMAAALSLPAITVHVFEDDMVNGLAGPDGRIFITRGFLKRMARGDVTPEEIASVIAHELGHVALGHSRRRMIDFTGGNVVTMVLAGVLNRVLPGIGLMIANFIAGAVRAKLSRRDEFEADAYATALLIKSGIGAGPQKSLFAKLDRLTGSHGAGGMEWLRSHPQTAERIAAIEANEARWAADQAKAALRQPV